MQRTLNWKFLLWTVGTLIVFALAIHVVHGLQVRQSAVGLLKQAERAEAGGDIGKAAILYSHYLAYQPQDVETEARLRLSWTEVPELPETGPVSPPCSMRFCNATLPGPNCVTGSSSIKSN